MAHPSGGPPPRRTDRKPTGAGILGTAPASATSPGSASPSPRDSLVLLTKSEPSHGIMQA
jgi:hypothetical protein